MKITVVTLFPEILRVIFKESILKRAQDKKLVELVVINLRDYALDKHKTVDDRPYGGGAGMVLMVGPITAAIKNLLGGGKKEKIILTSPRGKIFNQKKAKDYSKLQSLIIIAGHYEGVDERVVEYIDEEVSIGDIVLTGGELAAGAIVDSIVRLIPGVLEKPEAVEEESFMRVSVDELIEAVGLDSRLAELKKSKKKTVSLLEYPHFSRPEKFKGKSVPEILLSGDHNKIKKWRLEQAYKKTIEVRKDLLELI